MARKFKTVAEVVLVRSVPHAQFFGDDVDLYLDHAQSEEEVLSDFEVDGCDINLWDKLPGLGWDHGQIEQYVAANAAERLALRRIGYGFPSPVSVRFAAERAAA